MKKALSTYLFLFLFLILFYNCSFSNPADQADYSAMSIAWIKAPIREAKELGLCWVTLQIRWETLEPKRGKFDWQPIDKLCLAPLQNGLGITLVIYTGQGWATYCDPSVAKLNKKTHCPPRDLTDQWNDSYGYSKTYYNFVYNLVSHLKGKVNYFIIHNEVNSLRFWHGTPEQYLQLRKTAYKAVHDANSGAIVIDNGLASLVWGLAVTDDLLNQGKETEAVEFANKFFSRGENFTPFANGQEIMRRAENPRKENWKRTIKFAHEIFKEPYFDWFSFHVYENIEALPTIIAWIKKQMDKNGYEKPIIISECGYFDQKFDLNNSAAQQKAAEDLVKMHLIAFSQGIRQLHWLPMQEQFQEKKLFTSALKGLFSQNGQIRPAGKAWKYLNSLIKGDYKVKKIEMEETEIYSISSAGNTIYAAWSAKPYTLTALSLGKNNLQIYDIFGNLTRNSASEIELNNRPVYIK